MAKQYAHDLDLLGQFSLLRARVQNLSSDPAGLGVGDAGRIWFNTTTDRFMVWNGVAAIDFLARANHTGTQPASTISDFMATVVTARLDQFATPNTDINLGGNKITAVADGEASTDVVTRAQLDVVEALAAGAASGVAYKKAVRAVDTVGVTQSGPQTVDSVALVAEDRYLRAVDDEAANGIWVVKAGAHVRAEDAETGDQLAPGTQLAVTEGENPATEGGNADSIWRLVSDEALTVGTTEQTWERLPGMSSATYFAGDGMSLTDGTFDVGAGLGIEVGADAVAIDTDVVRRKIIGVVPNASGTVAGITVTVTDATVAFAHNLGNPAAVPEFRYGSSPGSGNTEGQPIYPDFTTSSDGNTTTVIFPAAPGANQYRFDISG